VKFGLCRERVRHKLHKKNPSLTFVFGRGFHAFTKVTALLACSQITDSTRGLPARPGARMRSIARPRTEQQRQREADERCGNQMLRLKDAMRTMLAREPHGLVDDVSPPSEPASFHGCLRIVSV
jgi:hypothetical protein